MTNSNTEKFALSVGTEEEGQRLDVILASFLQNNSSQPLTRAQIKKQIEAGQVTVNGEVVTRPGQRVKTGEQLNLQLKIESSTLEHYDFPLDILHVDEDLLVINKPAGLSMHPGAGNKNNTLLNAVLKYLREDGQEFENSIRPGIVHRLDKDTSGVVVVARTPFAQSRLARQFAEKTSFRSYKALVALTPRGKRLIQQQSSGVLRTQIGRDPHNRLRQAVLPEGGRLAVTHWQVLEKFNYGALIDLRLETGRTHQIRVHMAALDSPIYGDALYGDFLMLPRPLQQEQARLGRQLLHAYKLGFKHPVTEKDLEFQSPLPAEFQNFYEYVRNFS